MALGWGINFNTMAKDNNWTLIIAEHIHAYLQALTKLGSHYDASDLTQKQLMGALLFEDYFTGHEVQDFLEKGSHFTVADIYAPLFEENGNIPQNVLIDKGVKAGKLYRENRLVDALAIAKTNDEHSHLLASIEQEIPLSDNLMLNYVEGKPDHFVFYFPDSTVQMLYNISTNTFVIDTDTTQPHQHTQMQNILDNSDFGIDYQTEMRSCILIDSRDNGKLMLCLLANKLVSPDDHNLFEKKQREINGQTRQY